MLEVGLNAMGEVVHRELIVPNDTHFLLKVRQAVAEVVRKSPFPERQMNLITIAVDEAVANIMEHAYADISAGEREIELILEGDDEKFEVIIRDSGKEFDPDILEDVNIEEHVYSGRKDGLGVFMMRRIMDEVNYSFKHGVQNELQMIKYVNPKVREKKKTGAADK